MAKQSGIVFFEGTLGGINFYYRKGVPTARRAGGGFNRAAIKHGKHMERVRESNSEFAMCSQVNKHFKQALVPFLAGHKDGTLHSRLMGVFLGIKDLDTVHKRGQRTVAVGYGTVQGKRLLMDFDVTPERPRLLDCDYGFDWDSLEFDVSGYGVGAAKFPKGADYMEVLVGVVRFDFDLKVFERVMAAPLVIDRDFDGDSFAVTVSELPEGQGELIAVARVAFYQRVNGKGYLLPGGAGFGVAMFGG